MRRCAPVLIAQFNSQVMVQNMSQASPISVNGVVVSGKTQLEVGDVIQLLGHRFEWHRDQSPDSVSDADLEASYQISEFPLARTFTHMHRNSKRPLEIIMPVAFVCLHPSPQMRIPATMTAAGRSPEW